MNYNEFIQNIINTRGQWDIPKNTYYEKHHIIPLCLGGTGDFKNNRFKKESKHNNCIWLYPEEHFIAHKLLAIENPQNYALVKVFQMLLAKTATALNKDINIVTEYDYALCRRLLNEIEIPQEVRLKQSISAKNKKPPTKETRQKLSEVQKQRFKSDAAHTKQCKACPHRKEVYCLETNEVFLSMNAAAKKYHTAQDSIRRAVKLKWATAAGYHWALNTAEDITNLKVFLSNWQKQKRQHTEQFKEKLRVAHKNGRFKGNEKKVRCIELNKIFNNLTEAALFCNIKPKSQHIGEVCGTTKKAGGYHWEFIE